MPTEFPRGSITMDFAKKVTAPIETFERYHTVNLGAGAVYVPGDEGLFSAALADVSKLRLETQSGAGFIPVLTDVDGNNATIGDGTNFRYYNTDIGAHDFVVMRYYLTTATYERYYNANLGAGLSYTPADEGFFSMSAINVPSDAIVEYKFNAAWILWHSFNDPGAACGATLAIGDGTNMRVRVPGGLARWVVLMRTINT